MAKARNGYEYFRKCQNAAVMILIVIVLAVAFALAFGARYNKAHSADTAYLKVAALGCPTEARLIRAGEAAAHTSGPLGRLAVDQVLGCRFIAANLALTIVGAGDRRFVPIVPQDGSGEVLWVARSLVGHLPAEPLRCSPWHRLPNGDWTRGCD